MLSSNAANSISTRTSTRDKCTLLHIAAAAGCPKIVALLLQKGADRKIQNASLELPIQFAARELHEHVVPVLKEHEAETSHPTLPFGTRLEERDGLDTKRVVISPIGRGGFGRVYLTQHAETGRYEAVKVVASPTVDCQRPSRQQELRSAIAEAETMLKVREDGIHSNIVAIREVAFLHTASIAFQEQFKSNLFIFMDFVQGRTLSEYALANIERPLESLVPVLRDVARDILFIEEKNVIIRDLENIFVEFEGVHLRGKLIDFGAGITPAYASREMILGLQGADETAHAWSFGTTLLAVLWGRCDWSHYSEAVRRLKNARQNATTSKLHRDLLDLCTRCMQNNPIERCSMNELFETLPRTPNVSESPDKFVKMPMDHLSEIWNLHTTLGTILSQQLTYKTEDCNRAREHFKAALELATHVGKESQLYTVSLNNFASSLRAPGHLEQAKLLDERALSAEENSFGSDHLELATTLNNLAFSFYRQGDFEEAKLLYERALETREKALGPNHPEVATSLNSFAILLHDQGHLDEARTLYERALDIRRNVLGPYHPEVATSLNNLAALLKAQGHLEQAKPLYEHALGINEKVFGIEDSNVATSLNNLAALRHDQGHLDEAKSLFHRTLKISEKAFHPDHPVVTTILNNLALLLQDQGHFEQAKRLHDRALEIGKKAFGPNHTNVATSLDNLAVLLKDKGHLEEEKPLHERALDIKEKARMSDH